MKHPTLNQITWKRSKIVVLTLSSFIILISLFLTINQTNNWHKEQDLIKIHKNESQKNYQLYLKEQDKIESKINKTYQENKSQEKTWKYISTVTDINKVTYDENTNHFFIKQTPFNYDSRNYLFRNYSNQESHRESFKESDISPKDVANSGYFLTSGYDASLNLNIISIFLFIAGFALFFLDYKSNFILLLLSSSYSRKEIFKSKIKTSLLPLLAATGLAIFINISGIYLRIPHEYINYPLSKLIYLHVCIFAVAIAYYFFGILLSLLFGQTLTGILSSFFILIGISSTWTAILRIKSSSWMRSDFYSIFPYSWWFVILMSLILAIIFYIMGQFAYRRLSLENRNNYLLFPKIKLPFAIIAGCLAVSTALLDSILYTITHQNQLVPNEIENEIIFSLLIFFGTFSLITFLNESQNILNWFHKKMNKKST